MVSIEQTFLSLGELFQLGNGQPKMGRGFCSPQSTREGGSALLLSRSHVCYLPTLRYSLCIYIYFDLQVSTHDIHVLMLYPGLLYLTASAYWHNHNLDQPIYIDPNLTLTIVTNFTWSGRPTL